MDESIISTKNLTKVYGKGNSKFRALDKVNLTIQPGESVAVVGKSGSGKSTLMHLMALMDSPTSGSIAINGQEVKSLSKKEQGQLRNRTFGFVFQQFFLDGNVTSLENVILPLKIGKMPRRMRKKRAAAALKAVGLEDKIKSKAKDLSGGQKQRVVIARALVNNPKVIFADEPTGNLDSVTGAKVENLLFNLNRKHGITIVIVTHDADLAAKCSRQVFIKDGRIIEGGDE